jgi:hypothetical protein
VITTTGNTVEVLATSTQTATATARGGAGGVFTAASVNATSSVASAVQAFIRGGTVTSGGAVTVRATQTATSLATTTAGGVGVATTAPAVNATASITGDVVASIVGAVVTAAGAVTVESIETATADANTTAGGGGVVSVSTTNGTSTVGGTNGALIGAGASISAGGALTVNADTSSRSHASASGGDGGGFTVSSMIAQATTSVATSAVIGAGATVTGAASIAVTARRDGLGIVGQDETTFGDMLVAGVGLISGAGGRGQADDTGAVTALIGDDAAVAATGAVAVNATSVTNTKGNARGGAGGGVVTVVLLAYATHSATTTAAVGSNTGVVAGSLSVVASATTDVSTDVFTLQISLAGGAGSDTKATSSGLTEARIGPAFGTSSPANPRQVIITGAATVAAQIKQTAIAGASAGGGGGVAIGGLTVGAFVDGSTRAFIGNGANVQAGTLTVEIVGVTGVSGNPAIRTATATSVVGSVGLVSGAGSSSTARVGGSLDAFIGSDAVVAVGGAVVVSATGTASATASAQGGTGGAAGISAFFAAATVAPQSGGAAIGTRASVGAGARVSAASLRVVAVATDSATATVVTVAVQLLGGAGGSATATVDSDVEAFIGPRDGSATTVITTTGNTVEVLATSTQTATATARGGAGGVFTAASVNATSSVASAVQAFIRGGTVTSGGAVTVRATQTATSLATTTAGGVGVATTAPAVNATASITGDVVASIVGAVVTAAGAVTVESIETATADANTTAGGGGVVSVSTTNGTSTVGGTNGALIGAGASISAGGALTVNADTSSRSHASASGGDGGGFTVSSMIAQATTSVATSAVIGAGATVTGAASIAVTARRDGLGIVGQDETTFGDMLVAGVGLISGAGGRGQADDTGAVTALIGDDAAVAATGAVAVNATSVTNTKGNARGGAGGGVVTVVLLAYATHSATTTAAVGSNTGVVAGSLSVVASATTDVSTDVFTLQISLAGGAGSDTKATSSGLTEARIGPAFGTSSPANPRQVIITGAATVAAQIKQTAIAGASAGGGGGVAIGGLTVGAFVDGSTRAFIGNGANVQAGTLNITVGGLTAVVGNAALRTATASSTIGSVGLVAAAGSSSTARISGSLDAFIGANAIVAIGGAAIARADGTSTATATAQGGSGGAVGISAFFATATIAPTSGSGMGTRAWIGGGANVSAASLQLLANEQDDAKATLLAITVALAAGGGGTATATVDNDVETFIGSDTTSAATVIRTTGGNLDLIATASQTATTPVTGGGGGGIDVGFLNGNATVQSSIRSFIGNGTTVAAAGTVQIRAEVANAVASSTVSVGSGGIVSVAGVGPNARSNVVASAFIGDGVTLGTIAVPVQGDVIVTAIGKGEADSVGTASGGGAIRVATPQAKSFVDPTVDAHVGTSAAASRTTVVVATGSITVTAQLTKGGGSTADDTIRSVSASGDTLTFSYPGVGEGAQVLYSGPAIGGVNSDLSYTLLDAGTNLIRLGALFNPTNIDTDRETITFAVPHGFKSGDCVWYDPRAGSSMVVRGAQANDPTNGCNTTTTAPGAQRYFVRVIDARTIQLTTTFAAAMAATDATITATPGTPATAGDPTPLTLSTTAGLAVGTQVLYRAPVNTALTFFGSQVNVTLTTETINGQTITVPSTTHDETQDNLFVDTAVYNALNTGDAVLYRSGGPYFGLANDTTYYVIKSGDGFTVRFAATFCQAVGAAGGTPCDGITVTPIDFTIGGTANNGVEHNIARSLGGLVDGQTYYIASIAGNVVTLAATSGGPGLVLDATNRPGVHRLGIVEIDLENPTFPSGASTTQAIFANITTNCASNCGRLLAPSGQPLSSVFPVAGNGISTATAQGGNGGAFAGTFLYSEVTGSPSVAVTIAALQLIAGVDVMLTADSSFDAGSSANTDLGGAIAVGTAKSWTDLGDSPTSIDIAANATVTAGRDVTALAKTNHNLTSSARAVGGGLIAVNDAQDHAFVDNDVTIAVGTSGAVTAGRALRMDIASTTSAATSAETWLFGGGVVSLSDHSNPDSRGVRIGTAADQAMRSITIGASAQLTGRTVELDAAVVGLNLNAHTKAEAYCPLLCTASAFADSSIDLWSRTLVQVLGNAVITGVEGVDLKARHVNTATSGNSLNVIRDVYSIAVAIIPPQRSTFQGTDSLTNEVNTDPHSLIIAGARRSGTPPGGLAPSPADMNVALYVQAHNDGVNYPQIHDDLFDNDSAAVRTGDILWDGDVIILGGSGGQGYLVVGTDGRVLAANGVQVRNAAGTLVTPTEGSPVPLFGGRIVVGAIAASGAADILMQSDNTIRNQDYVPPGSNPGNPNNPWPTFEFRRTLSDVTIINLSPGRPRHRGHPGSSTTAPAATRWSASRAAAGARQLFSSG